MTTWGESGTVSYRKRAAAAAFAVSVFFAAPAAAADMNVSAAKPSTFKASAPASPWTFQFTPYAWLVFVTGTNQIGSTTSSVDTNLFDIIDNTDHIYAWMSYQELRNGPFSVYANVVWAKMRYTNTESGIYPIGPLNNFTGTVNSKIWVDFAILEPGVTYQLAQWQSGAATAGSAAQTTALDVVAGARYWFLQPDITLNVNGTLNIPALGLTSPAAGSVSAAKTIDWWDPFVGLRLRHTFAPGHELVVQGDVGGFDVGSQFAWQALATYNFATHLMGLDFTTYVGYRALSIDYTEGSGNTTLALDLIIHGPVVGVTFTW